MIAFALAVSLVAFTLPRPGDSERDEKFFICPNYREFVDGEKPEATWRIDPLWLLEKEDEWIPFRTVPARVHQPRTFRCIFYYLAAFSHFMLDLFTPAIPVYYVYPYRGFESFRGEDGAEGSLPDATAAGPFPSSRNR